MADIAVLATAGRFRWHRLGADANGMDASVVRWQRYGMNRLYVTAPDGTKLGYRDLCSGEDHVHDAERHAELVAALAPRQRTPDGEDLVVRRAGESARQQAVALQQAAPVRTFLARVFGVRTEERAWRIGADGEVKVAAQLAKLRKKDPRWHFLNAIPVGTNGADIDHLVVGPGGVFSLNAKHHPGGRIWVGGNTLMVNGHRQPYVRNSRHEASRASRLLSAGCGSPVAVRGVVVPVGAAGMTVRRQPDDVRVVGRRELVRWLRALPMVLGDEKIEAVFAVARRSSTWQPAA